MAAVNVHEVMALDGVVDASTWDLRQRLPCRAGKVLGSVTAPGQREHQAVRAMPADGLVDELHLLVRPRLFAEDAAPAKPSLAASEADDGVVYLNYRRQA